MTAMPLWSDSHWFAIQTKPHRESLASVSAARLGLEVFLPRIQQSQLVFGSERLLIKALFPGYFFARFCPMLHLAAVRHSRGVLRVVGSGEFIIPVDDGILTAIQRRVQANGFIQLERSAFQPGERVAIEQGPLAGWLGRVEREWNDGQRVLILLEALEQARALVEKRWLTHAAQAA
jgi:transcriptional antiterminator RfaH